MKAHLCFGSSSNDKAVWRLFPEVAGIRSERWLSALAPGSAHLQRKSSNFSPRLPDRYDKRPSVQTRADCCLVGPQMTWLQQDYGPLERCSRPLAGIIRNILDRGCVGGKQVLAHCSIKLSSGKSSKKMNSPSGGGRVLLVLHQVWSGGLSTTRGVIP